MGEILDDGTSVRRDRPRQQQRREAPPPSPPPRRGFDQSEANIDEVKDHVRANPDQAGAVLAAERASDDPRKTLVEWLESRDGGDED
jgi:hypothetical protein